MKESIVLIKDLGIIIEQKKINKLKSSIFIDRSKIKDFVLNEVFYRCDNYYLK